MNLRQLHEDLWPSGYKSPSPVDRVATRELTKAELEGVLQTIKAQGLLTNMISAGMFGAYGMEVYEHPTYPGLPPTKVLLLVEGHLPGPTRYDRLVDRLAGVPPERRPGCGRDDAWEIFSRFTHSEQNRAWLKMYGMQPPQERYYYDY
jgi:hypothetical protein